MNKCYGKINFWVLLSLIMLVTKNNFSQSLTNYASVRNTAVTYTSINVTGSAFDSWRNTTSFTQDDNRSDFTDIGFDFWYNGVRYTQFSVSTNGFIDFSSSNDDGGPVGDDFGFNNAAFTGNGVTNQTNPAIAPFYDDLTAQGGTNALGNSLKYLLTGSAPNRTLTIEWINMAVYLNTSPSLNFQVKLIESSGVIQIHYSTMNAGTVSFSYSSGLNAQVMNDSPSAAQLKELQTANTNSFGNIEVNNLSIMPAANSQYVFTPLVPTAAAGALSFSGITQTGMTLNWPNWATNEVGYVIYNSIDNVNFNFVTQTAQNAASSVITGLSPSTTYYWRLYAVTEGCLSAALTGTQATLAAGNKISAASGSWSVAATWSPIGVPNGADNVTIANGHTVTINNNVVCNHLTVGQGASGLLTIGNNATPRTIGVNGNITINTGATFNVNTASNAVHLITIPGNIINNGTLNFATDAGSLCNATFNKNGSQTLSGTGATTTFNNITLNMGTSVNNVLDIQTPGFVAPTNFLTLTNGTFKLSTTGASNIIPYSGSATIPQKGGIWINSAPSTINVQATLTMYGNVTVSNGIFNTGNAADEDLLSNGGFLTVNGGTLNIASKYYAVGINNLSKFTISGGNVVVPSIGSSNTTTAPFQIAGAGSQFNMSGGSLIIPREGGTGGQNLGFVNTGTSGGTVTGGTLQIGSTTSPANQIIQINSTFPIGNLSVSSASVNATLLTNTLSVISNVTINSGTLTASSLAISLGRNWTNNGGTFVPGTGRVLFTGTSSQTVFKAGGETFNAVNFTNTGTKTLLSAITTTNITIGVNSNLDVNTTTNNQITFKGTFTNGGTFSARKGLVLMNGTAAQSIGGTSITNFYDLTLNNNAGASLASAQNLTGTLNLNNGTFSTNSQVFTMVSTATNTARIAQITGTGDITGNVNVQRFAPGGTTGWALLGTPISSALTLQDWDDDIFISCGSCPDGSAAGFKSIYTYDETKPGAYDAAASYIALSNITDPIVTNKGYWVYLGSNTITTTPITLDVVGTVRKFNNAIPLTRTNTGSPANDGWNLIHNPYPSPVKWSLLRGATANLDNAIYAYNADLNGGAGGFATYVNGISSPALGSGGIGDTIPMCQGFYVHATAATTINATEANKVSGNPTFLKMNSSGAIASSSQPLLRLYLNGSALRHDETVLYMQVGATNNFDTDFDAIKMAGQNPLAPTIALVNGAEEFQVNGVAPISSNFTMRVKALTGYSGTYTISLGNYNSFPVGSCISLYDTITGITTNLKTNQYVFTLSSTLTTARFKLNITIDPLDITSSLLQPDCDNPSGGNITAVGNNSGPWNYYWKDANGNALKTTLNKAVADTLQNISGGNYSLELNTVGTCDNNDSPFTIDVIDIPQAQFSSADTIDISNGDPLSFNNTSINGASYNWNFGDGSGLSSLDSPTYYYSAVGIYSVTLIATSSSGCNDTIVKTIVVTNNSVGLMSYTHNSDLVLKTLNENEFTLQGNFKENSLINVKLHDVLGKLIVDYGNFDSNIINLPLDLRGYKPGIYFLNITGDNAMETIKLPVK